MARKVGPEFGVEGELYMDGGGDFGQAREDNIIDYNRFLHTMLPPAIINSKVDIV